MRKLLSIVLALCLVLALFAFNTGADAAIVRPNYSGRSLKGTATATNADICTYASDSFADNSTVAVVDLEGTVGIDIDFTGDLPTSALKSDEITFLPKANTVVGLTVQTAGDKGVWMYVKNEGTEATTFSPRFDFTTGPACYFGVASQAKLLDMNNKEVTNGASGWIVVPAGFEGWLVIPSTYAKGTRNTDGTLQSGTADAGWTILYSEPTATIPDTLTDFSTIVQFVLQFKDLLDGGQLTFGLMEAYTNETFTERASALGRPNDSGRSLKGTAIATNADICTYVSDNFADNSTVAVVDLEGTVGIDINFTGDLPTSALKSDEITFLPKAGTVVGTTVQTAGDKGVWMYIKNEGTEATTFSPRFDFTSGPSFYFGVASQAKLLNMRNQEVTNGASGWIVVPAGFEGWLVIPSTYAKGTRNEDETLVSGSADAGWTVLYDEGKTVDDYPETITDFSTIIQFVLQFKDLKNGAQLTFGLMEAYTDDTFTEKLIRPNGLYRSLKGTDTATNTDICAYASDSFADNSTVAVVDLEGTVGIDIDFTGDLPTSALKSDEITFLPKANTVVGLTVQAAGDKGVWMYVKNEGTEATTFSPRFDFTSAPACYFGVASQAKLLDMNNEEVTNGASGWIVVPAGFEGWLVIPSTYSKGTRNEDGTLVSGSADAGWTILYSEPTATIPDTLTDFSTIGQFVLQFKDLKNGGQLTFGLVEAYFDETSGETTAPVETTPAETTAEVTTAAETTAEATTAEATTAAPSETTSETSDASTIAYVAMAVAAASTIIFRKKK